MKTPQEILGEIVLVIVQIVSIPVLVGVVHVLGLDAPGPDGHPSAWVFLPGLPVLLLAFKSTRWMMLGIEYITGFRFAVFGWFGIIVMFIIGAAASMVVIPTGLLLLTLQYLRTRKLQTT